MFEDVRDLLPKGTAGYRHRLECHREGENIKPTSEKWVNCFRSPFVRAFRKKFTLGPAAAVPDRLRDASNQ
jgi:hypothetical protein